jgi:hypothetical protein
MTNERKPGGRKCPLSEKEYGSPRNKTCSNTCCLRTANRNSTLRKISKAADPVPLSLIPQILSKQIHEHGGSITGINVRRNRDYNYQITMIMSVKGEEAYES